MSERILVTGGCGFIGRHLCRALLAAGRKVRVLDCLLEQVHGRDAQADPAPGIEFVRGDIRDPGVIARCLAGVDAVVHLASDVGVGQSMYEVARYTAVNELGTAVLLEGVLKHGVRRVVVASSMSIYGEGLYVDSEGKLVADAVRESGCEDAWDPLDRLGRPLRPVATPETKSPSLASVYALNKYAQERMCHIVCEAHDVECCTLRLFNVFGPGQALSNPYTGVLAIFASRVLNGQRPLVFEDGEQKRDFVHISDVVNAFTLALNSPAAAGGVFNIASGHVTTVSSIARAISGAMGKPHLEPAVLQRARKGDIRHCFADISLAKSRLGFEPKKRIGPDTLDELASWVSKQRATDRAEQAHAELEARGLLS